MDQIVIGIMYTEGEDMNTLAVWCCTVLRVGGSYWQHRRVCLLLSLSFDLGAWIYLAWPKESLLLLHKATLQPSRAATAPAPAVPCPKLTPSSAGLWNPGKGKSGTKSLPRLKCL